MSDWVSVSGDGDVVCTDANAYIVYLSVSICEKHPHMSVCMYACVSMCVYVCTSYVYVCARMYESVM